MLGKLREIKAQELMGRVYKYASTKAMKVWFGYDIDYQLANPPEIIATLPDHAKINIKRRSNKYFGINSILFYGITGLKSC